MTARRRPGARDRARRRAAAAARRAPEPARPRCWRGASRASPPTGVGARAGRWCSPRPGPTARAPAAAGRGAARRPLRGALDRHLGRDRRAAAARALRGGRPRPLLRRPRPGRAAGDAARPPRRAAAAQSHEIRGNPAGLLARLLERIDALKAGAEPARARTGASSAPPTTGSSPTPAASTAATSSSPSTGSSTSAPTSAPRSPTRFAHADGRRARGHDRRPSGRCSRRSPSENPNHLYALEPTGADDLGGWFRERPSRRRRDPARAPASATRELRFWRCANERAQAQAVAREVEHLLAGGRRAGGRSAC